MLVLHFGGSSLMSPIRWTLADLVPSVSRNHMPLVKLLRMIPMSGFVAVSCGCSLAAHPWPPDWRIWLAIFLISHIASSPLCRHVDSVTHPFRWIVRFVVRAALLPPWYLTSLIVLVASSRTSSSSCSSPLVDSPSPCHPSSRQVHHLCRAFRLRIVAWVGWEPPRFWTRRKKNTK